MQDCSISSGLTIWRYCSLALSQRNDAVFHRTSWFRAFDNLQGLYSALTILCGGFVGFFFYPKILFSRMVIQINAGKWIYIWARSRNCGCLVTWLCYQLIAKPGNKTATVSWPDPYINIYIKFKCISMNNNSVWTLLIYTHLHTYQAVHWSQRIVMMIYTILHTNHAGVIPNIELVRYIISITSLVIKLLLTNYSL